jgi:hypothetical protein
MKTHEYKDYTKKNVNNMPAICFHCDGPMDGKGVVKIVDDGTSYSASVKTLWFHRKCFIKIAGLRYIVEE